MASRFDIAIGKVSENKNRPVPTKPPTGALRTARVQNFVSRLKLVNSLNGQEVNLDNAEFNLSVGANPMQIQATISINFTCSVDVAQRLLSRD